MSKFLVIGDCHFSDKPPSRRGDTYTEDLFKKLEWLIATAADRGCSAVVQLGDLFHIKSPSRTSHRLVQRLHETLTAAGIPVILTVGNHDLSQDRLESLDSQPLGALGRMEGIEVLTGAHESLPLYAIPYLQDWQTLRYWVEDYRSKRIGSGNKNWVLTMHAPIFPDHETPPYEHISGTTIANLIGITPTWVAYGHIHDPHGVYQPKKDLAVRLANFGAISRGSLHIETLKRKPQAYIFDTETGEHEVLDIPHRPAEEIFPLQEVNAEKAKAAGMTAFLEGVGSGAVDATDIDSVLAAARDAQLGSEVESVVVSLLTSDE